MRFGLGNLLLCRLERVFFKRLQKRFGFDPWHCVGTYHCRPYQRVAVSLANTTAPKVAIEIGCGLGEIITRIDAPYRAGYDLYPAVIDAARHFRKSDVHFRVGSGSDVKEDSIDLLIAINWIHNLSPDQLRIFLEPFYRRTSYFLLEAIKPTEAGYKFKHDFAFLKDHAKLIEAVDGGIREPRTLMLFKIS